MNKYKEYKGLNLAECSKTVQKEWETQRVFEKSLESKDKDNHFVFYEGPPSANGVPGIHHVMARTIKDLFCRYQTLKGKHVGRKGGWDTHGLPVELGVEKSLGITKEDIGSKISIEDYNLACRREVMKYKDLWDDITQKMGYWVDLQNPYITFDNKYIESVWHLLKQLYQKNSLYKGYTIQPFSPAAGTGLSSHELNLPGCYRDVKDTTVVAQFKVKGKDNLYLLAWTTTPWTLPSNTALAVGVNIDYVMVSTTNPYSGKEVSLILAKNLLSSLFPDKGEKSHPYQMISEMKGTDLIGWEYEQLLPWVNPGEDAFRVIAGDFVTTEDGTGIVHIAPTFGADDDRVAKAAGVPPLIVIDKNGNRQPMVDKIGKFYKIEDLDDDFVKQNIIVENYQEFSGKFVKNAFDPNKTEQEESLDVEIAIHLKKNDKAFKIEKYTHNYPHCWRTDKPILYYPLDSWFIKTTAYKQRMLELNQTINWKPAATGTGRFGNWLENLVDWNLSRSRFWGIPLPIWVSEDKEIKCIGSIEELQREIAQAQKAGLMSKSPYDDFVPNDFSKENYNRIDLHKPYIDEVVLVSDSGKPMYREPDLIDVWFDSGAMPYCQLHYPFENREVFETNFPADFIAEGVDQTRGWFFTLHAIAVMLFDSVAYKNVVSNGLVLDKFGNKMSKRLGNGVDPFMIIDKYGADATRWYMMTNAQPWDNLKFDEEGIAEVQRKFFGTLYNTYSFFALYANIDGFAYKEAEIPINERPEIDRWILSQLNTLIKNCDTTYTEYEPTKAGREIQEFVDEYLSNWYVRLCRRRFWKGEYSADKISAYQTLYTCLVTIAKLAAPIAPFFTDRLFQDLNTVSGKENVDSIHLSSFPEADEKLIDKSLEERMQMAQQISSMVLSLRKKHNLRVRQPLQKIMIPVLETANFKPQIERVKDLILSEVNVKNLEFLEETEGVLVKKIKPNFKTLGPKYGKIMKAIASKVAEFSQKDIAEIEKNGRCLLTIEGEEVVLESTDVEITAEDIPGWVVAAQGALTVALDTTVTEALLFEAYARELINRIQNYRKDAQMDVVDKIVLTLQKHPQLDAAFTIYQDYICNETLCKTLNFADTINSPQKTTVEIVEGVSIDILVEKV